MNRYSTRTAKRNAHWRLGYHTLAAVVLLSSFHHNTTTVMCESMSEHNSHHQRQKGTPWLQEDFPQQPDAAACRSSTDVDSKPNNRICDPDHVLPSLAYKYLADALRVKRYTKRQDTCLTTTTTTTVDESSSSTNIIHEQDEITLEMDNNNNNNNNKNNDEGLEIQMGVAVVQRMDLTPFGDDKSDLEQQAAETFGRYIHDQWGVGLETDECGGAGVLLFLSIEDRAIYISRGSALEAYLTDRRLDSIIESTKDHLRAQEYDKAISMAFQDMLAYIDRGPPTLWENGIHFFAKFLFPFIWIASVAGVVFRGIWKESRMRRDYVKVASQLSEIDRTRAEALQGQYCATSCPICLEEWKMEEDSNENENENDNKHRVAKIGSDGQPIKLLRCGHCMDDTCWAEWVSSGRGTITKCPICQQDVGLDSSSNHTHHGQSNNSTTTQGNQQPRQDNPNNNDAIQYDQDDNDYNGNEERIMRQNRRERNFRLARLGYRYPEIIRPSQLQRWTQPTHDGSLVRDPSFVQSNPSTARPGSSSSRGSNRMGGSSFGGSSSGGGRGGRW